MIERLTRIDAHLHSDTITYAEDFAMAQPLIVSSRLAALRSERAKLDNASEKTPAERRGRSKLLVFAIIVALFMAWHVIDAFVLGPTPSDKAWCLIDPAYLMCPRVK